MRRTATAVIGFGVILVLLAGLILVFQSRDKAELDSGSGGPGIAEKDGGFAHTGSAVAGATSGPHRDELITRDRRALTPDQIVHALELGNVVITFSGTDVPPKLEELQQDVSRGFDPELAAAGQSVILAKGDKLEALAWARRVKASDPADPQIREFAEHWLGLGAPGR